MHFYADIFNHRSSSRVILRCKSQPSGGDTPSVWKANEQWRKSLSPSFLKSDHEHRSECIERSIFSPSSFLTLYLPGHGNKPLDPMAVSAVHRTLVDTPAPILAVHLTRVDLSAFGLLTKGEVEPDFGGRLTDPTFHSDLLERYLCLRTLLVVTILAASNLNESARVLSKWIRVADEAGHRLKNYFGFHCLASGLLGSPHLVSWSPLWSELKDSHGMEWSLLNGPLRDLMHHCLSGEVKPDATVPNVLPLITQVSWCWEKEDCSLEQTSDQKDSLSACSAMMPTFSTNAQMTFRHLRSSDDLLLDLFRTEFHIRLLWGSKGVRNYPANFSERHTKFAKVLTALAAICARQIWFISTFYMWRVLPMPPCPAWVAPWFWPAWSPIWPSLMRRISSSLKFRLFSSAILGPMIGPWYSGCSWVWKSYL